MIFGSKKFWFKKSILFFSLLCGIANFAKAIDVSGSPGAFAPIPIGSRGSALAGAQTAAPSTSEAILYNPAALANTQNWNGAYSYSNMYALVPFHYTSASYRLKDKPYVLGAAWTQNGDDVYSENTLFLGAGYANGWVHIGGTYKLRFAGTGKGGTQFVDNETNLGHQVSGTALGLLGFDLGATVQPFGPKYVAGVSIKDILSRIAWDTQNQALTAKGQYVEYIPISIRYGFLFDPDPFLDLVVDFEPTLYHDGISKLATGIETIPLELLPDSKIKPYIHDLLAARIGYARNLFNNEASHRLSMGGGLNYQYAGMRLSIDMGYEWVYNFESNNNLRVGFNLSH